MVNTINHAYRKMPKEKQLSSLEMYAATAYDASAALEGVDVKLGRNPWKGAIIVAKPEKVAKAMVELSQGQGVSEVRNWSVSFRQKGILAGEALITINITFHVFKVVEILERRCILGDPPGEQAAQDHSGPHAAVRTLRSQDGEAGA